MIHFVNLIYCREFNDISKQLCPHLFPLFPENVRRASSYYKISIYKYKYIIYEFYIKMMAQGRERKAHSEIY